MMATKINIASKAWTDSLSPAAGETAWVWGWLRAWGNTIGSVLMRIPPLPDPLPCGGGEGVTALVLIPSGGVKNQIWRIALP